MKNSSNETIIEYGGILFFLSNLSEYLPYTLFNIFGAIGGTFGIMKRNNNNNNKFFKNNFF